MTERRRSPERLLQRAQAEERKEKRGKLKIYLGAAPGVGKTHEMLHDALSERAKGLDIIVGVVESHGRQEIEKMLKYFELLPPQAIDYHGRKIQEFDLDAALKRRPAVILMDEMAHTNAPQVRHLKRWQDIKELLDRGIDVYTTLNVQHIESVSDDVAQIIHAPIKETVPDSMIEMADTIELVDLPPEELLKRLQEGKVYIPKQAALAAEHFFRKGNLYALRELALRVTAARVGSEVLLYRQGEGIKHVWPTKDKILVCVGPNPESLKLIRAAKRMATSLQAAWIAVYVDRPSVQTTETDRNNAVSHLRLAEQLGAETKVLTGFNIVKEIINFARDENVTQIMIWKHIRTRIRDWFRRNLADELLRHSGEIDVYIMTGEALPPTPMKGPVPVVTQTVIPWKVYGIAIGVVAMITFLNALLFPFLTVSNLIMIYLLGVSIIALFGSIGSSILASVLSVLAFDFFFIRPYYSFAITDIEYLLTLIVMGLVATIISHLTILLRYQAKSAKHIQHQTSALYNLSRHLSNTRGIDKLLDVGTIFIADNFASDVWALLPKNNLFEIHSKHEPEKTSSRANARDPEVIDDKKEEAIAKWVFELGQNAGFGTDTLSFSKALYMPILASQRTIGVFKLQPIKSQLFTPEEMRLLEACVKQIALAIEVDHLQEQSKKSELQHKVEGIRTALLESFSHDLRLPLTAVLVSANSLIEMGDMIDRNKIKLIGKEIYKDAEQLSQLINNILQITYLESKQIKLQKKPTPLSEIIDKVLKITNQKLNGKPVKIDIPGNLPLISLDPSLIQEVLLNLIDNAVKFTPQETPINLKINIERDIVMIHVKDRGPGIIPNEVDKLFEKYYRGRMITKERGLGLGLAICRLIIEAHGGKIWAENREGGGAVFTFTLPL